MTTVENFIDLSSRPSDGTQPLHYERAPIVHYQGHPIEECDPKINKSKGSSVCRLTVHISFHMSMAKGGNGTIV